MEQSRSLWDRIVSLKSERFKLLGSAVIAIIGMAICLTAALAQDGTMPFGGSMYAPTDSDPLGRRFFRLVIAGGLGFGLGAFFSPKLKEFRAVAFSVAGGIVVMYALFGPYPLADGVNYLTAFVIFFVSIGFGRLLGVVAGEARSRPTSLGSAKWATYNYLESKNQFGTDGFVLGHFHDDPKRRPEPLRYQGLRHLLTVAPTRSGKGVSSIIPNLLHYSGSAFVIDPKGENAMITALRRGAGQKQLGIVGLGQDVLLLDPWDIVASKLQMTPARFNPLDWIRMGDPDAAENALILADALVISESTNNEDRFWDEEAKALLAGIILYVATDPSEAEHRTLGRLRDILTLDLEEQHKILDRMYRHPNPVVSSTGARQAGKDDRLYSSVMASAQSHTHFLDSPRIRQSLSQSDFRFEDLKVKPTSIYLILPADRLNTFRRWLRLLIQQAITVNARNIEARPQKPILFLLDEMAALGKLPALEQAYSLMAGFGMQLWGIVQDLSQLARIYGEHGWQTFISISGVIQYFGSRDKMTAEYFSTLCGVTTIELHNFSWAVSRAISYATGSSSGSSGGSSSSTTTTSDTWTRTTGTSEAQRKLAYPDELMVMKNNQQIVFVENLDPIPANKVTWYEDDFFRPHGLNLFKSQPALPPT